MDHQHNGAGKPGESRSVNIMYRPDVIEAVSILRTLINFLERGIAQDVAVGEVANYFQMCKQIETSYYKYRTEGFYMSIDADTGVFNLLRSDVYRYDLSIIADQLFLKFCYPSTPVSLLIRAYDVFMKDFGFRRVGQCIRRMADGPARPVSVETAISRVHEHKYKSEAMVIMEGFASISTKPHGMVRVGDLLRELLMEDECAETVVAMFAVVEELDPRIYREIKRILFKRLREKLEKLPHARLWLKMVWAPTIIDGVNAYGSLLDFILELLLNLSSKITCQNFKKKEFSAPPGTLTYEGLVYLIAKLYRNGSSSQKTLRFVMKQCGAKPSVWHAVRDFCLNAQNGDEPAPPGYVYRSADSSFLFSFYAV